MPTGDWCAGETKETNDKVKRMAENVSKAHRDPTLRKHLDDQKRLSLERISQLITESRTQWTLLSNVSEYTKRIDKNLRCTCVNGHQMLISLNDIISDTRCKICQPKKNAGSLNPAYKGINVFQDRLLDKFGEDKFLFDPKSYGGLYHSIEFECTTCRFTFIKAPRVLLNERIGCPKCASKSKGDKQRRTKAEFLIASHEAHGDRFTYNHRSDQTYGNADTVSVTCSICSTTQEQSIQSHLIGNGCGTCSQKRQHTTESFIEKSKRLWGDDMFDYSQVNYVNNKVHVTLICKKKNHIFSCSPANHISERGCPHCAKKRMVSVGETEWLDSLVIPQDKRNIFIRACGQKFNVDALINSTIYEYYGDYWHGNMKRFDPDRINVYAGMTMRELNEHTTTREQLLREAGYVVITMWEFDWMKLRNTRPGHIKRSSPSP